MRESISSMRRTDLRRADARGHSVSHMFNVIMRTKLANFDLASGELTEAGHCFRLEFARKGSLLDMCPMFRIQSALGLS